MIIDSHIHLGKAYSWASYSAFTFDTPLGPREYWDAEVCTDVMKRLGIDRAVVMPSKQSLLSGDNTSENDEIARLAAEDPERFIGMVLLNPFKEGVLDDLERYVREYDVKAVKLHPHAQGYGCNLPQVHGLVEKAAALGIPVMVHSGTPPYSTPLQIAPLAHLFPEATIILAHMGLGETYAADAVLAAELYENIYLETSICTGGYVKMAIDKLGSGRVMYGSDSPWNPTEIELQKIHSFELGEQDERNVLCETAARVFKL